MPLQNRGDIVNNQQSRIIENPAHNKYEWTDIF